MIVTLSKPSNTPLFSTAHGGLKKPAVRLCGHVMIAAALLVTLSVGSARAIDLEPAAEGYNHLVISYGLLEKGGDPAAVRLEFVQDVALARLPQSVLDMYRRLSSITYDIEALYASAPRGPSEAEKLQAGVGKIAEIGTLGARLYAGDITALLAIPRALGEEDAPRSQRPGARQLGEFEFDLQLLRSQLIEELGIASEQLIRSQDLKTYLRIDSSKLTVGSAEFQSLTRVLDASPRLYPAAYLAALIALESDPQLSREYADLAIESIPSILYRAPIAEKAMELSTLACFKLEDQACVERKSVQLLQANPKNEWGIVSLGMARVSAGRYIEAKALLGALPRDSRVPSVTTSTWLGAGYVISAGLHCRDQEYAVCAKRLEHGLALGFTGVKDILLVSEFQDVPRAQRKKVEALLEFSLATQLDWRTTEDDILTITNTSSYAWTSVTAGNTFARFNERFYRPYDDAMLDVGRVPPGESFNLRIGDHNERMIAKINVELTTDQGDYSFSIVNQRGNFLITNENYDSPVELGERPTTWFSAPEVQPPPAQPAAAPARNRQGRSDGGHEAITETAEESPAGAAADRVVPDYDRAAFGAGWVDADGDCQNSRTEALIDQSLIDVVFESEDECRAVRGRWISVFTNDVLTAAEDIDIDHLVPLKWAWERGAFEWTVERRKTFANDPTNLLSVEASLNRQKGAKGPDEWLPPDNRCAYVSRFERIRRRYDIAVDPSERARLGAITDRVCQ